MKIYDDVAKCDLFDKLREFDFVTPRGGAGSFSGLGEGREGYSEDHFPTGPLVFYETGELHIPGRKCPATKYLHNRHEIDKVILYMRGYPNLRDPQGIENMEECHRNLQFYRNSLASRPNGAFVEDIHNHWYKDFKLLHMHEGYIQWLFPIRELSNNNEYSQPLYLYEREAMRNDPDIQRRFLLSYGMMLWFYGMKFDGATGEMWRHEHFQGCYRHLMGPKGFNHRSYRMIRLLKSLAEMGYEHFQLPLIKHVLEKIVYHVQLTDCWLNLRDHWIQLLNDEDQAEICAIFEVLADSPDRQYLMFPVQHKDPNNPSKPLSTWGWERVWENGLSEKQRQVLLNDKRLQELLPVTKQPHDMTLEKVPWIWTRLYKRFVEGDGTVEVI